MITLERVLRNQEKASFTPFSHALRGDRPSSLMNPSNRKGLVSSFPSQ